MTATQDKPGASPEQRIRRTRPGIWSTLVAFLRADFIEEISYPMSAAFTMVRTVMPLFLSYFIGELIRDERVGDDYLTYVTIGLALSAMLSGALMGFGGSLTRAFMRGTLETYLVEPVPWTFLPLAMNTWQLLLGIFQGVIIMVVGAILGANFMLTQIPAFIVLILLGVVATTAIGVVSASVLMLSLKSQPILHVYSLAASLLAGAAFSVTQLPPYLRVFSYLIPHTYVINGSRTLLMENPGTFVMPFRTAAIVLTIFSLFVFPIGLFMYRRSLEFARRMGLLSGY